MPALLLIKKISGGLMKEKIYDILIVGAGTAGLSAAIYARRAGKNVIVLEEKMYGGQIVVTPEIENYPGIAKISGFEFAQNLYQQAKDLGMEYQTGRVRELVSKRESQEPEDGAGHKKTEEKMQLEAAQIPAKEALTEKKYFQAVVDINGESHRYLTKSVILATGAKNRPLGLAGEEQMIGHGISYCATCDGMFFRGRCVAVAGGGNTAMEDAAFLSQYCEKVYLIHRREEFRGERSKLEMLEQKENVEILRSCVVTGMDKDAEGNLEKLHVWDKRQKEEMILPAAGLFIAVGQIPDNGDFLEFLSVDEQGYIKAGEDCKTVTEGVFAAGDCRTKGVRQLTTAAADGAVAALAACEYCDKI